MLEQSGAWGLPDCQIYDIGLKEKTDKKQRPKSKPPLYHQRYKPRQSANRTGRSGPDPGEWRAMRGELTEVSGPTSLRWVVKCILCDIKKTEAGRLFTHLERFTPGVADLVKRQSQKTNADKAENKPPAPYPYKITTQTKKPPIYPMQ